jgi:hypothetical protein
VRWIGYVTVAIAIACGPHGVRLDSTEARQASGGAADAPACQDPGLDAVQPNLEALRLRPANSEGYIPLNTRGYNYQSPGGPRSPIPSTVGLPEEEAPPQ